jgi:hypothetical protein
MKNFALIVIDATEVDLCVLSVQTRFDADAPLARSVDLGSMPNKRTRWTCDQTSGEWKEEGLVP